MSVPKPINRSQIDQIIVDEFGVNASYVSDLLQQFDRDPASLDNDWRLYFTELIGEEETTAIQAPEPPMPAAAAPAATVPAAVASTPLPARASAAPAPETADRTALRGAPLKIVENMEASLALPTATSQRQIPIKLLDENRRLINQHLAATGRKISFTHVIARAMVKAFEKFPRLNDYYERIDGQAYRVRRSEVNLGIAVDVQRKDGSRFLFVPNVKSAQKLSFPALVDAYDDLVKRARDNKLQLSDFQNTTVTLTNPGTIGTTASNPRLMAGQGVIIATGAIEHPPEYLAMAPEALSRLGISKIMTITSTYDHRIIQGAESGMMLAFIDEMLRGKHHFYDEIFSELNMPYRPYRWAVDVNPAILGEERHRDEVRKQARVLELINAYRVRGHLIADVNPLGWKREHYHKELDIESYKLTIWDLDREFITGGLGGAETAKLREIVDRLRKYYCGKIGVEYRHIQGPEEKEWIRSRVENEPPAISVEIKKQILWKIISGEQFERFLGIKYLGQKRFSIEGAETVVAMLDQLIEGAPSRNIDEIVIGMSHRGRLNVLANVVGRFCERIFTSFEGSVHPRFPHDQGDVKYHQGASGARETSSGKTVKVSVMPNPSHLEFIDPVVQGVVRAKQDLDSNSALIANKEGASAGNSNRYGTLAVLAHGDAAFAGEGIVAETLNLSQLPGYTTGGTIHIIVNNQVGFTTPPEEGRSSTYSTDVAKMVQAPIFHVNGNDPEAAYNVLQIAIDYRQQFHKDIVIDVMGFRKHGHNEGDEPSYTLPVMYRFIQEHPGVREIYAQKLVNEGALTAEEVSKLIEERTRRFENALLGAKEIVSRQGSKPVIPAQIQEPDAMEGPETGVDQATLRKIAQTVTEVPRGFNVNPKIVGLLGRRAKMVEGEPPADWGMAEALAFGSLLAEGTSIRISGQDTLRGTFSQRHAAFYDMQTGDSWVPLTGLAAGKTSFRIYDSPLSEAGALGFEYGYSVAAPTTLVVWEAQFGDFINAAQVIVDQFIIAGEEKWNQATRLVLLLPHGYEGQGPEHSSGRIERFLQLCAEGNIQVTNCTTTSQYFHLLRRQVKQSAAKPLVVMTPKSLLRSPEASSPIDHFIRGRFMPVIGDDLADTQSVTRALLCTGKIYYDLNAERKRRGDDAAAILRVEQLYPFPKTILTDELNNYPNLVDVRWVQEEPANMGGWNFIEQRLREILKPNQSFGYAGRPLSASSATGSYTIHQMEQRKLIDSAFED